MMFFISEVLTDNEGLNAGVYLGKTASVQQWFCEQEKIPKVNEAALLRVSEKAMLFRIGRKEYWIPKSLMMIMGRKERSLEEFA